MVLWEITLGTAYFLGLKRTYRLALKIQRRLVGPKHVKIRQFLHRRTRTVFDVALRVHRSIQERDIEVGRNFGNWILRWLDRMKPEAQIRGPHESLQYNGNSKRDAAKKISNSSHLKSHGNMQTQRDHESGRHLFSSSRNIWAKAFPTVSMVIQPPRPAGSMTQYRHFSGSDTLRLNYIRHGYYDGVIRKDIMQWMLQK